MKCFHCGAEIEDGSISCSHCGNPLEVVTDIFSDNEVLVETSAPVEPPVDDVPDPEPKDTLAETQELPGEPEKQDPPADKPSNMIEKKKMYIILGILCVIFLIILILMAIFWRKPEPAEEIVIEEITYGDVVEQIEEAIEHQNFGLAMDSCAEALTFGECDEYHIYKDYLKIYKALGKEDKCLETLLMLKEFAVTASIADDLNEWYEELLGIYSKRDDTYNVGVLINEIEATFIGIDKVSLLKPFVPADPVFSDVPSPAYPGDRIYISSPDGSNIFMGKISKKNGTDPYLSLYHGEGLVLKAGRNEFAAMCENQYGLKSNTVNFSYVLKTVYDIEMPQISPASGEYKEETFVEIEVPFTYKAFYCWDDDPDTESTEYTEKIEMLEGNHVFSAILMDKYGNISNIQRMNYIYIPEKEPEEEEEEEKPPVTSEDSDNGKGKNGGSNIIKDASDTPTYHGKVTDPPKDEDQDTQTGDDESGENTAVSGNDVVSGNTTSDS